MRSFDLFWEGIEYRVEWSTEDGNAWVEQITFSEDGDTDIVWCGLTPENARVWEKAQKRAESAWSELVADSRSKFAAY